MKTNRPMKPNRPSAPEILEYLTPQLINVLADLDGAPASVAHATVQLLPFGSRAALEATGLAVLGKDVDGYGHHVVHLTPLAFRVMSAAADRLESSAACLEDLDARMRRASGMD
jgi:hypothetical protein